MFNNYGENRMFIFVCTWYKDHNGRATSFPSARLQFASTQNVDEILFEMATDFIQLVSTLVQSRLLTSFSW